MFKQIFESQPIQYVLPTPGETGAYFDYLTTPPRLYAETIAVPAAFPLSLFAKMDQTTVSDATITLIGVTQRIYFPGYELVRWRFDGMSGAFLERTPLVGTDLYASSLALSSIVQGFDRSLWACYITGDISEFDPQSYELLQTFTAAHFGRSATAVPLVDKARDLIIMPAESGAQVIVYTLSTGAIVRSIGISATPISICAEDDRRVYVLGANYVLSLVDYTTGEIISAAQCPVPPDVTYVMSTWDNGLRRVLVFAIVPDASDGSCQSTIKGYYPVPLATHLTTPIPLASPRRGRQVPVLLRAVGDVGEPIAGVTAVVVSTPGGSIYRAPGGTDGNGDAVAIVLCDAAGDLDLSASASIDD